MIKAVIYARYSNSSQTEQRNKSTLNIEKDLILENPNKEL